jgi:hybrid cluster-associated redox disulfide protein
MKLAACQPEADCTIDQLLEARPGAARILLRHGMACVGCPMARFETVAEAAREYRVDLGTLLKELRRAKRDARRQRAPSPRGRQAGSRRKSQR